MVFVVKPPAAPLRLANARRSEKIRIENRATVTEDDALLRNRGYAAASSPPAEPADLDLPEAARGPEIGTN